MNKWFKIVPLFLWGCIGLIEVRRLIIDHEIYFSTFIYLLNFVGWVKAYETYKNE